MTITRLALDHNVDLILSDDTFYDKTWLFGKYQYSCDLKKEKYISTGKLRCRQLVSSLFSRLICFRGVYFVCVGAILIAFMGLVACANSNLYFVVFYMQVSFQCFQIDVPLMAVSVKCNISLQVILFILCRKKHAFRRPLEYSFISIKLCTPSGDYEQSDDEKLRLFLQLTPLSDINLTYGLN